MSVDPRPRGKYLAHYTSLSMALEYILPTQSLKFGTLETVNDPRENKRKRFTGSWTGKDKIQDAQDILWKINKLDAVDDILRRFVKMACFTQDAYDEAGRGIPATQRSRMWAQYGDRHRGVCLIFDRESLDWLVQQWSVSAVAKHAASVHYVDYPSYASHTDLRLMHDPFSIDIDQIIGKDLCQSVMEHAARYWYELFFVKAHDWRDESEFRFVILGKDQNPSFLEFGPALRAIVIGEDCAPAYDPCIREFSMRFEVPSGRIKSRNGIFVHPSWNIYSPPGSPSLMLSGD